MPEQVRHGERKDTSMKLKDFIKETLIEIAEGIDEARYPVGDRVAIAPSRLNGDSLSEKNYIEFDIAVTANEIIHTEKGGKGSVGVKIEVLGNKVKGELGGSATGETQLQNEKVSRVQFKVPVYFGATYDHKRKAKQQ
ncbi:MAG: hypothetical protein KGQ70_02320 [Alphaproteobacteria bacterium]|nr:hypothetical protein [Alphaproteobacteria bacterium]